MRKGKALLSLLLAIVIAGCATATQPSAGQPAPSTPAATAALRTDTPTVGTATAGSAQVGTPAGSEQGASGTATAEAGLTPVPLEQLIDRSLLADVQWASYSGQLWGKEKGELSNFSVSYPAAWSVSAYVDPSRFSVQSFPETNNPPPLDFVKLEILALKGPVETEETEDRLVEIAGEVVTLYTRVETPGRSLMVHLTLPKNGRNYAFGGYVDLREENQAVLDKYRMILLAMMASFKME
jgi:hypothetical protein